MAMPIESERGLATSRRRAIDVRALGGTRILSTGSIIAGLAIWSFVSGGTSSFILASPAAVAANLYDGFLSLELPLLLLNSLGHLVVGLAISIALSFPLGFAMGRNRVVSDIVSPVIDAIYAVPIVAFVPFLIVWFGLMFEARVALVVLMCIFDMTIIVAAGFRDIDRNLIEVGRSFGAGPWKRFLYVLFPASVPFLFTALRIGTVRAVNAMITAELFFAAVNLGAYMKNASNRFDSASLLAVLVILCGLGLGLQSLIRMFQRRWPAAR